MNAYIQTRSGICFDLEDPKPELVSLGDICYALENIPRYTGHGAFTWSVADHSLFVAELGKEMGLDDEGILCCLLHDATEAYVGDLSSPLKALCPAYRDIEARVWRAIAAKFNLPGVLPTKVKLCDAQALLLEAPVLLGELRGPGWPQLDLPPSQVSFPYRSPVSLFTAIATRIYDVHPTGTTLHAF